MTELTDIKAGESVLAVMQQDDRFRSIELRKRGRSLELLSYSEGQTGETWLSFAQRVGVLDGSGQRVYHRHEQVVLGLPSVGVSFYRMTLPQVGPDETKAMVQMQVETRLPLPGEEMEIDWKTLALERDQRTVAVAACRKVTLLPATDQLMRLEPHAFHLEAEAVVQAWKWIFKGDGKDGVILSCNAHHIVVCSARGGQLVQAAVLDCGIEDLSLSSSLTDSEELERHQKVEQVVQDLEGLLLLFDADLSHASRVAFLSDGSDALHKLAQTFIAAGLDVIEALPETPVLTGRHVLEAEALYAYRVPMGLALCELDTSGSCFTLFADRCGRPDRKESAWLTPWIAGLAAGLALLIMAGVLYGIDVMRHRQLTRLIDTPEVKQFQKEQAYQKVIALHRPDMLELIELISAKSYPGIILDTFHFQKEHPVKITGRADQLEQWYAFEKALIELKGVSQVEREPPVRDEKDNNKVKFSVSFHYKTFTKRNTR